MNPIIQNQIEIDLSLEALKILLDDEKISFDEYFDLLISDQSRAEEINEKYKLIYAKILEEFKKEISSELSKQEEEKN